MKNLLFVFFILIPNIALCEKIKVACVGDSITEGSIEASYPTDLQNLLGKKYLVKNFGAGKRTVLKTSDFPYWKECIFHNALSFSPKIVIINFGLNDTKPWNWQGGEKFKKDYITLIRKFRTLKSHPKVFIAIPTPLVVEERFGLTSSVLENEVIPEIRKISKLKKVPLINLHDLFIGKPELQPDLIHPNAEGMELIAKEVYKRIKGKL